MESKKRTMMLAVLLLLGGACGLEAGNPFKKLVTLLGCTSAPREPREHLNAEEWADRLFQGIELEMMARYPDLYFPEVHRAKYPAFYDGDESFSPPFFPARYNPGITSYADVQQLRYGSTAARF